MKRLWELITIDDDREPLFGHPCVFPVFLLAIVLRVVREWRMQEKTGSAALLSGFGFTRSLFIAKALLQRMPGSGDCF